MNLYEIMRELEYYQYVTCHMNHHFDSEENDLYSIPTSKHHGMRFYDDGYYKTLFTQSTISFELNKDGCYDIAKIPGEVLYWLPPWGERNVQNIMVQIEFLIDLKTRACRDSDKDAIGLVKLRKQLCDVNITLFNDFCAPGQEQIFTRGSDVQHLKYELFKKFNKDPSILLLEMSEKQLRAIYNPAN